MRIHAKWENREELAIHTDIWQVKLGGIQETKRALAMHSDVWQVDLGGTQETKTTLLTRTVCVRNFVWDTEMLRGYGVKQEMRRAVWETLVTRKVCMRNFVWDAEAKNEMEACEKHEVAEADLSEMPRILYFSKFPCMHLTPLHHICAIAPMWCSRMEKCAPLAMQDVGRIPGRRLLIPGRHGTPAGSSRMDTVDGATPRRCARHPEWCLLQHPSSGLTALMPRTTGG